MSLISENGNDPILDFVSHLGVMKPSSAKKGNAKAEQKLLSLFESPEYVMEDKVDGCHYFQVACRYFSTDRIEKTDNYPHMRDFFIKLNMPNLILDGEMNYPGRTSQYCTRVTGSDPSTATAFQNTNGYIHYTIWDMLRTPKGTWLLDQPLTKRREILTYFYNTYIKDTAMEEFIHLTTWTMDNKKRVVDQWIAEGKEGGILKKLNSTYSMGKKPAWIWLKYKAEDSVDLFITGFEPAKIAYTGESYDSWAYWMDIAGENMPVTKFHYFGWIGALELSAYVDGKVKKVCTCAGIDEKLRKDISDSPERYLNKVVKIFYMETTEAGFPRHPRFDSFHESKVASDCEWAFETEE